MRKLLQALAILVLACAVSCAASPAQKKYVVLLADYGIGMSTENIKALESSPLIKVAAICRAPFKAGKEMEALVKGGRLEPVVSLTDEPILPLIYEFSPSTSTDIKFSWPDDVADIVARDQERVMQAWPKTPKGLLLESGAFDANIAQVLRSLGLSWVAVVGQGAFAPGTVSGVTVLPYISINDPKEVSLFIHNSTAPVLTFLLKRASKLTPAGAGEYIQALRTAGAEIILPTNIPRGLLPELEAKQFSKDLNAYTARRDLWKKISLARTEIENYKNSGSAQTKTLEVVRSELYHLYASPLIIAPPQGNAQELEQEFQAGLFNVYQLIGKHAPNELPEGETASCELFISSVTSQYCIECSSFNYIYHNPPKRDNGPAIEHFSVKMNEDAIIYGVTLTSASIANSAYVDVYMDLNNIRGAGSTMMLTPVVEGYLNPEDAWEYAIQINRTQAVLYRAGRFQNSVVATLKTRRSFEVSVPRSVLRGNALRWGYQAVLVVPSPAHKDSFDIADFLVKNESQRVKVLKNKPTYLPAARINK